MKSLDKSRDIAFSILKSYFSSKKLLKILISKKFSSLNIPLLDKRFIYSLVKGIIRHLLYIDYSISIFSNKKIEKIDKNVLILLRMGLFQIIFMDKIPSYSAVDESVELAKKRASRGSSKFVNAILRKASSIENLKEYINKHIEKNIRGYTKKISMMYSFPEWIISYWQKYYEKDAIEKICKALNKEPMHYIRFNPEIITKENLQKELGLKENNIVENQKLPPRLGNVNIQVKKISPVLNSSLFKKGIIFIQDISSQIAVEYFASPKPGEKILDLCAAPGGKAILISKLAREDTGILALDISGKRLEKLKENLERFNIKNIDIMQGDATSMKLENKFDKIFIDAPCSAFGTISKNPDVKYNKRKEDLERLKNNSLKILNNSKNYLKPSGKIIFYTCTLSPIENQETINTFLAQNKGEFIIEPVEIPQIKKEKNYLEILPHLLNSEAGFVCSLKNIKN